MSSSENSLDEFREAAGFLLGEASDADLRLLLGRARGKLPARLFKTSTKFLGLLQRWTRLQFKLLEPLSLSPVYSITLVLRCVDRCPSG